MNARLLRRGYALVEMAATMAVGSAMVGVAVSALYLLTDVDRGAREEIRLRGEWGRLSRQYRDDVHAAVEFRAVPPGGEPARPAAWELLLPEDRVIEYGRSEEAIWRRVKVAGKPVSRDSFAVPLGAVVSIEVAPEEPARLVRLCIVPPKAPAAGPAVRPSSIDAVLGRDYRFLPPEER